MPGNIVFCNGDFCKKSEAKISAFDHGFLYGDGVYETLLIEKNEVENFEAHYSRLKNSCASLGISFPKYFNSEEKIKKILEHLIDQNQELLGNEKKGRTRITISRGENNFDFTSSPAPTVLIHISPLPPYPEKIMREGISIKTLRRERSYPEIKSTNFLASLMGRREIAETGEYEGVFVTEQGFFREGTVSNILAVDVSQKKLILAPFRTVLEGTMQAQISRKFKEHGYYLEYENFSFKDVQKNLWELYITNSLFGMIPVHSVDGNSLRSHEENNQKFLAREEI